jgi:hypothetical protein
VRREAAGAARRRVDVPCHHIPVRPAAGGGAQHRGELGDQLRRASWVSRLITLVQAVQRRVRMALLKTTDAL